MKASMYTEALGTLSNKKSREFLNELLGYLLIIKSYECSNVNDVMCRCSQLLEQYTRPFYRKWRFLTNLHWHSGKAKRYSSFLLTYSGFNFLLPYNFLVYNALNPNNRIIDQLKSSPDVEVFFFVLSKVFRENNFDLLENDLKIIKFLFNPFVQKEIPFIPTNRQIAQSIGCSENTISRRIDQLYKNSIISHYFQVEMAKLGFYTSLIIHPDTNEVHQSKFQSFCLIDYPIDWGEVKAKLKIFQIHRSNKTICDEIKRKFNPLYEVTLTKNTIGWNLNGLIPKADLRWKKRPPVLKHGRWDDHQFSGQYGIEKNLLPDFTSVKISQTQVKMLDIIQNGTTSNYQLSKTLNVGQKYIKRFYEDFFAKKLIHRFILLKNIGLESKVWVTLLGPRSNKNVGFLKNVVEHLKSFPFSFIFYNDNNLDFNGRLLLTGLIWMPSSWV
ncbi:MAG: Lrp/AsnC family transcriptional regulator, partial [Asgard group archaeon]|nr:Lrp/AsnC family transcriptional regulator [Asgard group archaeon]